MGDEPEREPTEQEVDGETRRLIEELISSPYSSNSRPSSDCRHRAIAKLWSQGYISDPYAERERIFTGRPNPPFNGYRNFYLTPEGWEYWEKLRLGTVRYWVKHNWFPVAVAAIAALFSLGSLIAGIVDLVLKY